MKTPWIKGTWYYEMQILMFVIMWQHTKPTPFPGTEFAPKTGFWLGRLHIWYDTAWLMHGIAGKIRDVWFDFKHIFNNVNRFKSWRAKLNVIRINAKNMFNNRYRDQVENWNYYFYKTIKVTKVFLLRFSYFLVVFIILCSIFSYQGIWTVRTPELFGTGNAYVFQVDDRIFGVINAWGVWAISGTEDECRLMQISGDPIKGAEDPINCSINLKGKRFKGTIDFRGQERPFWGKKSK